MKLEVMTKTLQECKTETAQVFTTMSEEKNYDKLITELSYPQYDCTIVKKAAKVKAFSLLRFGRTVLMSIFFQNQYHEITFVVEI